MEIFSYESQSKHFLMAKLRLKYHENGPMRFLGTRANQNFFKLGLVTHENGQMRLFGSRAILASGSQNIN